MRSDRSAFPSSPVIAAARLRTPRHRRRVRVVENNYIAETPLTHRKNRQNRNRPGAPLGNLNALKHGAHRAGARALRAEVWQIIRRVRLLIRLRKVMIELQKFES